MGKKKGAGGAGPGPQQAREESSASAAHDSIQTLTERVEQLEARLLHHESKNVEEQKSPDREGAVKQQARHSPAPRGVRAKHEHTHSTIRASRGQPFDVH